MKCKVEISFAQFKRETHHKKVKYTWDNGLTYNGKHNGRIKKFESEKFYSYKDKGLLNLPQLLLSKDQTWYKIKENHFKSISKHGQVVYEVITK